MRYLFAMAILCFSTLAAFLPPVRATAAQPESLKDLRLQKLKAAEEWRKAADKNKDEAPEEFNDFLESEKAVLEAKLDLAESQESRIAAQKEYVGRLQKRFDYVKDLNDVSARGGNADRLEQLRFLLIEAKIMLAKAQLKLEQKER